MNDARDEHEPLAPPAEGEAAEAGLSSDFEVTPTPKSYAGRFSFTGRTLRQHAARGVVINTVFLVTLSFLGFIKGFVLAGFLAVTDYGLFGITILALNLVTRLRQVGIGDKFIQQDDEDQVEAFQKAFTLELMMAGITMVLVAATLPLFALVYGEPDMMLPGLVLMVNLAAGPLQTPLWVFYRRMDFFRQRVVQSIDPVVGFGVSIALAANGAGYWALFFGITAGAWTTSIVSVLTSPYPLRLRFDRETLRSYWSFSAPLALAAIGGPLVGQAAMLTTKTHLGLAAAGSLTLAQTITQFTDKVDGLVTGTLYPAICAVRDRVELLQESFVKSNRLALMWAVPFGIGLSLFCGDLVEFGIGEKWRPAVPLLQIFGVVAAFGHIGFNWDAYFRALGETRPMAVAAMVTAATFLLLGIPLTLIFDLTGLTIAVAAQMAVHVACRGFYLRRLFKGFPLMRHMLRSFLPVVPAASLVLAIRLVDDGSRTLGHAVVEAAVYSLIIIALTLVSERTLLREAFGYLRRRQPADTPA